jgi:hypothetical protein
VKDIIQAPEPGEQKLLNFIDVQAAKANRPGIDRQAVWH